MSAMMRREGYMGDWWGGGRKEDGLQCVAELT